MQLPTAADREKIAVYLGYGKWVLPRAMVIRESIQYMDYYERGRWRRRLYKTHLEVFPLHERLLTMARRREVDENISLSEAVSPQAIADYQDRLKWKSFPADEPALIFKIPRSVMFDNPRTLEIMHEWVDLTDYRSADGKVGHFHWVELRDDAPFYCSSSIELHRDIASGSQVERQVNLEP